MGQMSEVSELLLYDLLFLQQCVIFHAMFTTFSKFVFVVYFCLASHDLHTGLANKVCTTVVAEQPLPKLL